MHAPSTVQSVTILARFRTMLVSTKIVRRFSSKSQVAREWRVVHIPEEDGRDVDLATLFTRIINHTYDPLEPFCPSNEEREAPIRAEIGKTQATTDFQGIPLSIRVADAIALFGVYIKFYLQ